MELLKKHREHDADITIATHSVGWGQATRRGLTRVDPDTGDSSQTTKPCGALSDIALSLARTFHTPILLTGRQLEEGRE